MEEPRPDRLSQFPLYRPDRMAGFVVRHLRGVATLPYGAPPGGLSPARIRPYDLSFDSRLPQAPGPGLASLRGRQRAAHRRYVARSRTRGERGPALDQPRSPGHSTTFGAGQVRGRLSSRSRSRRRTPEQGHLLSKTYVQGSSVGEYSLRAHPAAAGPGHIACNYGLRFRHAVSRGMLFNPSARNHHGRIGSSSSDLERVSARAPYGFSQSRDRSPGQRIQHPSVAHRHRLGRQRPMP